MEENVTILTVLQELRDFRAENNKRWEQNNKRWEENDKRWEQNDKRWEQNEKRWEENDKRWTSMDKRVAKLEELSEKSDKRLTKLEELSARSEQRLTKLEELSARSEQRLTKLEELSEKSDKRLTKLEELSARSEQRLTELEKGRKEDRKEILDVLDTMQRSIDKRFTEMRDYMDLKFEKIDLALAINNMEHAEFRKLLKAYGIKLDFYGARIESLEKWRDEINGSLVETY